MNKYLLQQIEDGLIINAVVWDGVTKYSPEGCILIPVDEYPGIWIGWTWDGNQFIPPQEIVEEVIQEALEDNNG